MFLRFARWLVSVALAATFLYLGSLYWQHNQPFVSIRTSRPEAGVPKELSGTSLQILHFYAAPASINTEEEATICYGVLNAARVEIDPPVQSLKPSVNRCISVAPKRPTLYTLTAVSAEGAVTSASFTLPVVAPPARWLFADTSSREIRRGDPFTVCYGVRNASRVELKPVAPALPPIPRHCYRFYPPASVNLTLTADGPGGPAEPLPFAVNVRR